MRCEQAEQMLIDARYERPEPGSESEARAAELEAHVRECERCSALQARGVALDGMLARDEPTIVGADFDARFFTRLAKESAAIRHRRTLRVALAFVPLAAAAAIALVLLPRPMPSAKTAVPPEELSLAMDLELVQELPVVQKLDEVEDFDLLTQVDDAELERALQEAK